VKFIHYILILVVAGFFTTVFVVEGSSKLDEKDMKKYVEPQVNISLNISNADGLKVEKLISDYLVKLGFALESSVSAGKHGKKWAEKGMVKSLWNNQGNYIDLSNLLDTKCFKLRIYTESKAASEDIEKQLLSQISKVYPKFSKFEGLQCR